MSTEIATGDEPVYPDLWSAVNAAKNALQAAAAMADEDITGEANLTHIPFLLHELGQAAHALTPKLIAHLGAQVEAEKIVKAITGEPMDPALFDDQVRWFLALASTEFKTAGVAAYNAWGGLVAHTHTDRQTSQQEGAEA